MAEFEVSNGAFLASIDDLILKIDLATKRGVQLGAALIEAESKGSFGPAHSKGTRQNVGSAPEYY